MANNRVELSGLEAINGGISTCILTEKKPIYSYVDNKKVDGPPAGWRIGVALHGCRFESLTVRIEGASDPLPDISDEDIVAACRSKVIAVAFDQLKVTLYTINGNLVKTGVAAGVAIVGK